MSYHPEFAALLDRYLGEQERSAAWLAQRLGINPATVTRWRNGNNRPNSPDMVVRIADILGIHGDDRSRLLQAVGYGGIVHDRESSAGENEMDREDLTERFYPSASSIWLSYPTMYRQAEMATLARWSEIGASGLVLGLAGSGVSTLLRYFAHRPDVIAKQLSHHKTIVPVWIELHQAAEPAPSAIYRLCIRGILETAHRTPGNFPANLLQACHIHLNDTDLFVLQTTLFTVLAHCQDANMVLVFAFDRIDQLTSESQRYIGNSFRAIHDRFRETVTFLMGMRITPDYLDHLYALGNWGRLLSTHTCYVGNLTEQDSCFVIVRRTSVSGVQFSKPDIEQFLLLSGGYPTLLKAVVRWWLTHTPRLPRSEWYKALLQEPGIQLRLREIWRCLSPQEQAALHTLITSPGADAMPDAIGGRLAQLGICRQYPQGWHLSGTLFAGML
jgi:transcriptional regulator with XRE-family HTH domain